jgi:hypothetical protein
MKTASNWLKKTVIFSFGVKQSKRAGRPQLVHFTYVSSFIHFTYVSSFVFLDKCEHDCKVGDAPQLCYLVNIPHILITYIHIATEYGRLYLQSVKEKMPRLIHMRA